MCEWVRKIVCDDIKIEKDTWEKAANNLHIEVLALRKELEQHVVPDAQRPTWLGPVYPYRPLINVEGEHIELVDARDIYAVSPSLEKIVREKGWKALSHDAKLIAIWKYVIHALAYRYDQNENWQFPQITVRRRLGDCEDSTILFVTLCKVAEIPADKVFNCVGDYKGIYHSFPIAQLDNGKWYIFETTFNNYPEGGPKLFEGSEYDAKSGCCNWKFAGSIDNEEKQI